MKAGQSDFRGGAFAATSTDKVPSSAVLEADNCTVDNEGALRRRGGCSHRTNADVAGRMWFLWVGTLFAGVRALWTSKSSPTFSRIGSLNPHPTTPALFFDVAAAVTPDWRPRPVAVINGWLIAATMPWVSNTAISVWAGGRTRSGVTGTLTLTQGSKAVVGVGTSFTTEAEKGTLLQAPVAAFGALGATPPFAVVASVTNNTNLTLQDPWEGATIAGTPFQLARVLGLASTAPDGSTPTCVAAVGDRLFVGTSSGRVYVSAGRDPATGALRPWKFSTTDYHGPFGGATIVTLVGLRDRLFIFTTAGVWVLSNTQFDIVDADGAPQRRLELHSADVVAVGSGAGITTFRDSLVVPASDDIYLVDGIAAPLPVSASARREWRKKIALGYVPGVAVSYRGHYLMPLLDAAGEPDETWLFRLDRPAESYVGTVFPWVKWSGQAGEIAALAVRREDTAEELWAAGFNGVFDGRILNLTGCFDQDAAQEADAGGLDVTATIKFRDFVGGGVRAVWRRVRIRYKLGVGGTVVMTHYPGGDEDDVAGITMGTAAPAAAQALEPYTWDLQRMAARLRVKLTVAGGDEFVLQSVEAEGRDQGR